MFIILFVVLIFLLCVVSYNTLIRKRNQTDNAFGAIDAILKKRFDLIPNLVAAVKQYAAHEQQTFARITELRNRSYADLSDGEKQVFDGEFAAAKRQFFALAENYPELKASENFLQLQRSLNETEEQLSAARRSYNAAVTDYNNSVQTFPSNLIAGMFGFNVKEVLSIPEAEREAPNVKDLFNS